MSPKSPTIDCFHHIQFFVSNALQASFWYCFHFGFHRFAQRRTRHTSEIAIRKGKMIFVFKCSTSPDDPEGIGNEVGMHGDFVKDVSFKIDDLDSILRTLHENGLRLLETKRKLGNDAEGHVLIARIAGSAGSIVHTLIQNLDYRGSFLPGFVPLEHFSSLNLLSMPPIPLLSMDHVVEAHPEHSLDRVVDWYRRTLRLHRFWSIDDTLVHTEHSALRAMLVGNGGAEGTVKMTLVEPAKVDENNGKGKGGGSGQKGQIQEFLDLHGSSGIQHIAFLTDDIIGAVQQLRERGVEFLDIPDSYYDMLRTRLAQRSSKRVEIEEDLDKIRHLKILLDFDQHGYLLQIFTKPVQDRMTFFLEIIQRHNFNGFGAGNFRALFAAVEMEQKQRMEDQEQQGKGS